MTSEATVRPAVEVWSHGYLVAKSDVTAADEALRQAQFRLGDMRAMNAKCRQQVEAGMRSDPGRKLFTTQQSLATPGGGYGIVHARCDHPTGEVCTHDAASPRFTVVEIARAEAAVEEAQVNAEAAREALAAAPGPVDAVAEAVAAGRRYIHWPPRKEADPRVTQVWRGNPVSDEFLDKLGPEGLRRELARGTIVDVGPWVRP